MNRGSTNRFKAVVSWSSGKDSAFALFQALKRPDLEIVGVLTTVSEAYRRVSMHGVREELLDLQVEQLGLPCFKVSIPAPCPNDVYERKMAELLSKLQGLGVTHVVFGDLFLEDIRAYREERLARVGMTAVFPLWGKETRDLAAEMCTAGLSARLTCIDPRKLDRSFAGRAFDSKLLEDLPPDVDPCGERGEFHSFVTAGPFFRNPLTVVAGDIVERDGFVFADLLPSLI